MDAAGSLDPSLGMIATRCKVRDNGGVNEQGFRRVLIVAEDSDLQALLRLALEAVGRYRVEVCEELPALVPVTACFVPDLVLLDLSMVGERGPELVDEVQTAVAGAPPPVVAVLAEDPAPEWTNRLEPQRTVVALPRDSDPFVIPRLLHAIWQRCRGPAG